MPSLLFKLQTLTLPLMLLPARYWPSALIAMAQISPGLFWSGSHVSYFIHAPATVTLMGAMKARGIPTNDLSVFTPQAINALTPYLHLPFEASTCRTLRCIFSRCDQVVYAEGVRLL